MSQTEATAYDGGFWRLRHDELAALLTRHDLSWETARVYLALADLTIGYGNERDTVSLSQMAERAGMYAVRSDGTRSPDCPHVARALRDLTALGLCGCEAGHGQSRVRWVVWPVPCMPTTAKAGSSTRSVTTAKAGNSATAKAGSRTTAESGSRTTARAGRHQDIKTKDNTKTPAPDTAGGDRGESSGELFPVPAGDGNSSRKAKGKPSKNSKPTYPRVAEFINWFCQEFQRRTSRPYIVQGGKDGRTVKALLRSLTPDHLQQATAGMFADSWGRSSASIGVLSSQINKWLGTTAEGSAGDDEPDYLRRTFN